MNQQSNPNQLFQDIHDKIPCSAIARHFIKVVKDEDCHVADCPLCSGYRSLWLNEEFFCERCQISGDVVIFYMIMSGKSFDQTIESLSNILYKTK